MKPQENGTSPKPEQLGSAWRRQTQYPSPAWWLRKGGAVLPCSQGWLPPSPACHVHTHDVHGVVPGSQRTDGVSKMEVGVAFIFNARKMEADRKLSHNLNTYSIKNSFANFRRDHPDMWIYGRFLHFYFPLLNMHVFPQIGYPQPSSHLSLLWVKRHIFLLCLKWK